MLKSIGVVLGSYVLSVLLVLAGDPLLMKIFPGQWDKGHVPSNVALVTSTGLFVAISILCAWLCARFAPAKAGKHVLWFFVLGEVMGIATIIPNWKTPFPHWYWVSWLLTWPVSCWIGLKFGEREEVQTTRSAAA